MAYIITADDDTLHAVTHGLMDRSDLSYLRARMQNALRSSGGVVSRFVARAKETLENINLSAMREKVETVMDRFTSRWDHDRIQEMHSIAQMRNAKPKMRKALMANPRYRALWQAGRAEGFGDLYQDDDVGAIGPTHVTFREIMNGSYISKVADEDHFVTYLGVYDEGLGEEVYNKTEKDYIRNTCDRVNEILDEGRYDPHSPICNTL